MPARVAPASLWPSLVRSRALRLAILFTLALPLCVTLAQQPAYLDLSNEVEVRVADLLERMTLEEKVGQMIQINLTRLSGSGEWDRGPLADEWLQRLLGGVGAGSLLSGGGAAPVPNTPRSWARTINRLQEYALDNTRLGIPILYGTDAVHGHNNVEGATVFPHNIGLAAGFDPELVAELARATAGDAAATGVTWNFSPVADLGSDPRWGRFYETFGSNPLLVSEMARAHVEGQRQEARIASTVKHFIGYGQAASGDDRAPADMSLRRLRDEQLPPFRAAVDAGAHTVMANSGSVNGVPVHASRYLLTDLLRGELGFRGPLLSDWADVTKLVSVHRVAADLDDAAALAVNSGVDVVMVPHDGEGLASALLRQVESGAVSEGRIDEAVGRVLALKFRLGLFEDPFVPEEQAAIVLDGHNELARRAALSGLTLLENRGGALPLSGVSAVAVAGMAASEAAYLHGGWTIEWQGLRPGDPRAPGDSVLEALQRAAPAGIEVREWAVEQEGAEPTVEEAENAGEEAEPAERSVEGAEPEAEAIVLVLAEPAYAEMQGDSDDLRLPQVQLDEARSVAERADESGARLIVVLLAGRPLNLPGWLEQRADALLMAYYPGSEGGAAIASVLLGEESPAGRLPFVWPSTGGQLPLGPGFPTEIAAEPLYELGHGLSYPRFRYSEPTVSRSSTGVAFSVRVENVSEVAGDEVVLLYVRLPILSRLTPQRQLAGFERVSLAAGEAEVVEISVPWDRLALVPGDVDSASPPLVHGGNYRFAAGGTSGMARSIELDRCVPAQEECASH